MLPHLRARHSLSSDSESALGIVCRVLLWFSLAALLPVVTQVEAQRAQAPQVDPVVAQTPSGGAVPAMHALAANPSTSTEQPEGEPNPAVAVEPAWVITRDSAGNVDQRIKVESDFAVGDHLRLGVMLGQGFVYNTLPNSSGDTETMRDAGLTSHWHPNEVLKLEGMFGVSQLGATVGAGEQPVRQALIPIANLQVHLTPPGGIVKVDLGFKRFIFDLSPQLVANRAERNDFVVHPQITLPSGWRLRALAEMGPVTSTGESNARYNSEFSVGHKLGKASELYSTYATLHFAQPSVAGYFSPDLVQNMAGGWTTDLDRKALSLSLDFGAGAGHARNHGDNFGPWGLSLQAQSYLTWTVHAGREVRASYEFYYDQSNPGVAASPASPSGAWHMSVLTFSFRWATQ